MIFTRLFEWLFAKSSFNEDEQLIIDLLEEADIPGQMSARLLSVLAGRYLDSESKALAIEGLLNKKKIAYVSSRYGDNDEDYEYGCYELI